jgi:predicted DCC family thiol-disulfide oxidoreductase YuxK
MPHPPAFPLTIFFDGACRVCAAEMAVYRSRETSGRLLFVDISAHDFVPGSHGISLEDFMAQLHVIDSTGAVYRGVEGFWAIWQAFPGSSWYGLLGRLIMLPGINGLAWLGYRLFARYRRFLPRRRHTCTGASCRLP